MNIIDKIEIKHFRSFDGGKDQVKVKIDELKDLNIFSGSNDSGKSNVLRALNLFFNNEISPGMEFNIDRDFSKIAANRFDEDIETRKKSDKERVSKDNNSEGDNKPKNIRRSDVAVTIKLFFYNATHQRGLPEKFWISKLYSQRNNFEGEYIYQTSLKGNAQATLFINNFKFEYVPAIKDRAYFSHLFEKLQTYLFEKEDKNKENKFSISSVSFNNMLKTETQDLFQKFQKSSGVDANFHIPSTLVDFFRTLSVRTENDISLFDRGDGVQARFIPEILDEISKDSKMNIIWGFEEPENSYEAKNIRKIRDEFIRKYSRDKQVFITSHSKEFLSVKRIYTSHEEKIINDKKLNTASKKDIALNKLKPARSSSDISLYRVWKSDNASLVARFDESNNEWDKICDDLGIIQESRMIEDLQGKLEEQSTEILKSNLSRENQKRISNEINRDMRKCLSDLENIKSKIEEYEKPILYVEDKYSAIYKIAYLKTKGIRHTDKNYEEVFSDSCPFTIRRGEGAGAVSGKLKMNNTDGYDDKKVIGLFDFDKEGTECFYHLKKGNNWDNEVLGDPLTGVYKKRNQHDCFYGLLLPIPNRHLGLVGDIKNGKFESFVEVENLLSDDILKSNGLVKEEQILTIKYLKIKNQAKSNLTDILIKLNKKDFDDFIPLYTKVEELFGLQ